MIVTCPLVCRISNGNGPCIIPGMPSGMQFTQLMPTGCPFAVASRLRCCAACHSFMKAGFNGGGLTWLTPSLGTVDALAPMDAQPPNLRDEMCGGHRRKPPAEDNDEEEHVAGVDGDTNSANAFMLSSLKPAAGKFVLGPPVDTTPPIVVFTGPADNPDKITETVAAKPKKHRTSKSKKKTAGKPDDDDKSAAKPKARSSSRSAKKPKVSATAQ